MSDCVLQKTIAEVTEKKASRMVCKHCGGSRFEPHSPGVLCSECRGSGIDSSAGKDARGDSELVLK